MSVPETRVDFLATITQVASRIEKPSFSRSDHLIVGKWVGFFLKSCTFYTKNSVFDA